MAWKAYRLVYEAKSPVHIGWHTLGYIKLTRYYITGKSMWGAMTANLTRAGQDSDPAAYKKWGDLLCTDVLVSYFYPALDRDSPLLPEFTDTGLKYGGCTASDFERLFIKSFGQTAVVPQTNTAEDETLHESEYISHMVNDGEKQQSVYFVGYVFIRDEATYNNDKVDWAYIKDAVSELFVGGDRKYGWGRLKLHNEPEREEPQSHIFGCQLSEKNNSSAPILEVAADTFLPAHLAVSSNCKLRGDIEPLVGREWTSKGAGQKIKGSTLCWMPGSIMVEGEPLKIKPYGVLDRV